MNPLAAVPNPFGVTVVVDAWNNPTVDVRSIHHEAFATCLAALARVSKGEPDSVLIHGSAGSGKTHVLSRFRQHLARAASDAADKAEHCVFVSAKLQTNARMLWQFVRRRLAEDLGRVNEGVTQLVRLVAHQIAGARGEPPRRWVQGVRVLPSAEDISGLVQEIVEPLGLGRGLGIVIGHLVHRRHVRDAQAWLAGESLPESILDAMGLGAAEPDDREEEARQLVCALCRLASESLPIVFCFDQIEALQTTADDRDSLFRFGRMAAELAEADRNVLLISSIQSSFNPLFDAAVRQADRDRAFRRRASLEPLTPAQVEALIRSRLDSGEEVRALRVQRPGAPDYPFSPEFMAALKGIAPALPRRVFALAHDEFARLQGLSTSEPRGDAFLGETFARRRDAALAGAGTTDSRVVLLHGLPMLWDLRKAALRPPPDPDLDFVADGPPPIAIAVSGESNMNSLARRLGRLVKVYEGTAAGPAVPPLRLVRNARSPIPRTARKTLEYLDRLERCGARMVTPSFEALAALEALRTLLSDARAGDLACDGEAVGEATVREWLTAHLDDSLIELADAMVAGDRDDERSGEMRALEDFLATSSIAPLDQVASELHIEGSVVLALARRNPERIGVLQGPPTVLFARVPAEGLPAGGQ